jgi:cell wall-associated NlpC family hydrolase
VRTRALGTIAVVASFCAGCGQQQQQNVVNGNGNGNHAQQPPTQGAPALHGHPQAIEPVAGAGGQPSGGSAAGPAVVSVGPTNGPLPQPVSDAEIRRELAASGLTGNSSQAQLTRGGLAVSPVSAPPIVQEVIQAGNQIAHLPYVWGGGHARFVDTGYDCSGSISFVFAAAGILNTSMTSGELANWGEPGPGKWITVFANNGHTFMYIAGLRFDTVALAQTGSRWSNRAATENLSAFAVRHPPGL